MIELSWKKNTTYIIISQFLEWLFNRISKFNEDETINIDVNGFLLLKEKDGGYSALIMCPDIYNDKKILNIVLQPPEEFKERYIACIPSEEPESVTEVKQTDEDGKINIEEDEDEKT